MSTAHKNPQLDHTDLSIFYLLSKINISENYVGNILRLQPAGKRIKEEEVEDLSLFGTFVVRASNAFSPRIKRYTQSRRTFATYQEILELQQKYPGELRKELQTIKEELSPVLARERLNYTQNRFIVPLETRLEILENRLINLSKLSRDGATFFDDRVVSKYVKIDATLSVSLRGFNLIYNRVFGEDFDDFEDIEPFFFPPTFSDSSGKDLQVGVKSANALGAAFVLSSPNSQVESYLCKTTEYGRAGIGKVVRMYWDKPYSLSDQLGLELHGKLGKEHSLGTFVYQECFLYRLSDISHLRDAPTTPPLSEQILDPVRQVVGIFRQYETDLDAPFKGGQLGPRWIKSRYIQSSEIGLRAEIIEALHNGQEKTSGGNMNSQSSFCDAP